MLNIKGFLCCQLFLVFLTLTYTKHKYKFQLSYNIHLNFSRKETILLLLAVLLISLHFIRRIYMPLFIGDVLYYHAPRPLFWIQNASMAAYPTMNNRQIVYAFGSDLIFMWPVLFTKSELIGRMIYWTGFPAAATGFYTIMRTMHCTKKLSLLCVNIFLSIPIIYFYGITLEPLIWVTFFALGSGYWALRTAQTSAQCSLFIFFLGTFCTLTGNIKNYGMALIPAGAASVLIIVFFQSPKIRNFHIVLKSLKIYISAIVIGLLSSGLGFLLIQNLILYGNPLSSDDRLNQSIAEFSLYQIYVHSIRIVSVLAEIPLPFGNQFLMEFGNWIINIFRADILLPKELEFPWIGHYTYFIPKWPGYRNFGIAGLYILVTLMMLTISMINKASNRNKYNWGISIIKSEKLPFAVVSFTLLLLTAYILRWIDCGTRSFITPGVICVLAFALSFLDKKYIPKKIYNPIIFCFLLFSLTFTIYQGNLLIKWIDYIGLDWSRINYTQKRPYKLIEEYVPKNATLLLLVHGNFQDYTAFGRHYTRKIIQVTSSFDKNKINEALHKYPNSYIYIHENRYKDIDFNWLQNNANVLFITENTNAKLFKFRLNE